MLSMAAKTRQRPEEIIRQAVAFFGPEGYKLEVKEQSDSCAVFEGGGGGVEVTTCLEGDSTSVELLSREWDYQVKEFLAKIK